MKKVLISYFSRTGKTPADGGVYRGRPVRIAGHNVDVKKISGDKERDLLDVHPVPGDPAGPAGCAPPSAGVLPVLLKYEIDAFFMVDPSYPSPTPGGQGLVNLLEDLSFCAAHRACSRGLFFSGVTAHGADIIGIVLRRFCEIVEEILIKLRVDFLYRICIIEAPFRRLLPFRFGCFDHLRIHFLEFVGFSLDRFPEGFPSWNRCHSGPSDGRGREGLRRPRPGRDAQPAGYPS